MNIERIKNLYLNERCTVKEIADKLGFSFWRVYKVVGQNNISRRNCSEASYLTYSKCKPRFLLKENVNLKDENLKIAGLMLYWAEGAKERATVDFTNSDPLMIKIFLRFLREICGIVENRIRIYLYAFSDQNIDELKSYWSKITGVPEPQFIKPYVRKVNPHLKDRRMPYGLIHVRYNDKRLLECIKSWLSEYKVSLLGAGGGVAKRTRL